MLELDRVLTKIHSVRIRALYPFHFVGRGISIHYTCEIHKATAKWVSIGNQVFLGKDVWINVVIEGDKSFLPRIIIENGCKIGRRSVISAKQSIKLEENVMLAPSVLIMDHNHDYSNPDEPISQQGTTGGGRIVIERNCWLGYGSVILCDSGELVLGRNCVVGANAVVKHSFPPYSVIAGNPARLVRQYDRISGKWQKVNAANQP